MKTLLRALVYTIFSLYLTQMLVPGFNVKGGLAILAGSAAVFTALNFLLKPILKIIFLPINFITLGLFSSVINILILYILIYFVPQIKMTAWRFSGFYFQGFSVPPLQFTKLMTVILASFVISVSMTLLNWIRK